MSSYTIIIFQSLDNELCFSFCLKGECMSIYLFLFRFSREKKEEKKTWNQNRSYNFIRLIKKNCPRLIPVVSKIFISLRKSKIRNNGNLFNFSNKKERKVNRFFLNCSTEEKTNRKRKSWRFYYANDDDDDDDKSGQ